MRVFLLRVINNPLFIMIVTLVLMFSALSSFDLQYNKSLVQDVKTLERVVESSKMFSDISSYLMNITMGLFVACAVGVGKIIELSLKITWAQVAVLMIFNTTGVLSLFFGLHFKYAISLGLLAAEPPLNEIQTLFIYQALATMCGGAVLSALFINLLMDHKSGRSR